MYPVVVLFDTTNRTLPILFPSRMGQLLKLQVQVVVRGRYLKVALLIRQFYCALPAKTSRQLKSILTLQFPVLFHATD